MGKKKAAIRKQKEEADTEDFDEAVREGAIAKADEKARAAAHIESATEKMSDDVFHRLSLHRISLKKAIGILLVLNGKRETDGFKPALPPASVAPIERLGLISYIETLANDGLTPGIRHLIEIARASAESAAKRKQ